MGPPAISRTATPNDAIIFDNDATYGGIWPNTSEPAPRKRERVSHMGLVILAHSSFVGGRSSLTNLSKSSAAWKFL